MGPKPPSQDASLARKTKFHETNALCEWDNKECEPCKNRCNQLALSAILNCPSSPMVLNGSSVIPHIILWDEL